MVYVVLYCMSEVVRGWAACGLLWHSFVSFSLSSFLRCIDLSLFSHCTTSHNAGHFLRLILSPCLVIRDNCQLSQGTIRSITAKSMQPLGLYCLIFSRITTTWNGKKACKSQDGYKTSKIFSFLGCVVLLENQRRVVSYSHVSEMARHQMHLSLLLFYNT